VALPTPVKTWTISPNNRLVFASLLQVQQGYLHGIKTFLKANGYTVKGSASAGVGAMDGVDRWTLTTDVTPRATVQSSSNAWIVLTDANGADLCLSYVGATDDVARLSYSSQGALQLTPGSSPITISISSGPKTWTRSTTGGNEGTGSFLLDGFAVGQVFTSAGFVNAGNNGNFTITTVTATVITASAAAGLVTESSVVGASVTATVATTNATPTSQDAVIIASTSTIGATASGDRLWNGWVDSTSKLCRFSIVRAGSLLNVWGAELITSGVGSTATLTPAVWSFYYTGSQSWTTLPTTYLINSRGGLVYVVLGGIKYVCDCGGGLSISGTPNQFGATVNQLNDDTHPLVPPLLGIMSNRSPAEGRIGAAFDTWMGFSGAADGDTYTGKTLIQVGGILVWPWDSVTTPVYT
jgi:hypothetical protein